MRAMVPKEQGRPLCRIRRSLERIGVSGRQADAAHQKLERICAQC